MKEISPATPLIGLTSIQRTDATSLSQASDLEERAAFVGRTIRQNVRSLYDDKTVLDKALEMIVPPNVEPDLLQPASYAAAFHDVADKVQADHENGDAPSDLAARANATVTRVRKAADQCRLKLNELHSA